MPPWASGGQNGHDSIAGSGESGQGEADDDAQPDIASLRLERHCRSAVGLQVLGHVWIAQVNEALGKYQNASHSYRSALELSNEPQMRSTRQRTGNK